MRVVSQDGVTDIPYEVSTIAQIDGIISARYGQLNYIIAEYRNPDVAALEMNILLSAYKNGEKVFIFPEDPGI